LLLYKLCNPKIQKEINSQLIFQLFLNGTKLGLPHWIIHMDYVRGKDKEFYGIVDFFIFYF